MKACSCSYAFRPYPDFTTSWAELNALALLLGAGCGTALDAAALYDFEIAPEIVRGGGSTANSVLVLLAGSRHQVFFGCPPQCHCSWELLFKGQGPGSDFNTMLGQEKNNLLMLAYTLT